MPKWNAYIVYLAKHINMVGGLFVERGLGPLGPP